MRDLGPSEHGETRTACDFGPVKGEEEDGSGWRGRGEGGIRTKQYICYYILAAVQRNVQDNRNDGACWVWEQEECRQTDGFKRRRWKRGLRG